MKFLKINKINIKKLIILKLKKIIFKINFYWLDFFSSFERNENELIKKNYIQLFKYNDECSSAL